MKKMAILSVLAIMSLLAAEDNYFFVKNKSSVADKDLQILFTEIVESSGETQYNYCPSQQPKLNSGTSVNDNEYKFKFPNQRQCGTSYNSITLSNWQPGSWNPATSNSLALVNNHHYVLTGDNNGLSLALSGF